MSCQCLKQIDELVEIFKLPLNVQPEWIKNCYSNYVIQSFKHIEQWLTQRPYTAMTDVIKSGVIKHIINLLKNNNYKFQMLCSGFVRQLSIQYEVPQELITFIDKLCIRDYYINDKAQMYGRWILCSIAAGSSEHSKYIIDNGAIQILIDGLKKQTSIKVKIPSIETLGNIAADDGTEHRDLILSYNVASELLPYCMHASSYHTQLQLQLQRTLSWTLMNLCFDKPAPPSKYIETILKAFRILILNTDTEILKNTCCGYCNISDSSTSFDWVLQNGVLPRLIQLLEHENCHIVHQALRTIGNVVAGVDEKYTQAVINDGGLLKLYTLMKHEKKDIRREVCFTVSNITAGSVNQIEAAIVCNLWKPLIDILNNEELEIAQQALYAISNVFTGGNTKQVLFLLNQGVIKALFQFSKRMNHRLSTRLVLVIFETLGQIMQVGSGSSGVTNKFVKYKFVKYVKEIDGVNWLKQLQLYQIVSNEIDEQEQNSAKYEAVRLFLNLRDYLNGT